MKFTASPRQFPMELGPAFVQAAGVEAVVHFVICFDFIRVMAYIGDELVEFVKADDFGVEFNSNDFCLFVPDCKSDPFDFERFFNALFAHVAVSVNFEFLRDMPRQVSRFEGKREGGNSQNRKKKMLHQKSFRPQSYVL